MNEKVQLKGYIRSKLQIQYQNGRIYEREFEYIDVVRNYY